MKIKFLLIALLYIALSININAQLKWGIRAGVSSSDIKLENVDNTNYKLEYNKGNYGWHAGLMGQLKILKLFVQPELLFSTANVDVSYTDPDSTSYGSQKFNKIDLPVMVGIKLAIFKFEVGPVGTYIINSKSKLLDEKKVNQDISGATFGYQAGIGVELTNLLIDFKYEGNLSKLGSGMTISGQQVNFDQRMSQLIFSIGYLF
jgi:hypothetical protein